MLSALLSLVKMMIKMNAGHVAAAHFKLVHPLDCLQLPCSLAVHTGVHGSASLMQAAFAARSTGHNLSGVLQVTHNKTLPTWLTFPDFQRVEWMNAMVEHLWPHASAAVVTQVGPAAAHCRSHCTSSGYEALGTCV